jgi:hypothetical protein
MTADPICADDASLKKKVDPYAPAHLAFDELEFGNPTLGAATARRLTGTRDGVSLAVAAVLVGLPAIVTMHLLLRRPVITTRPRGRPLPE